MNLNEYHQNINTLLGNVKNVNGDIIELGVYKGQNTYIIGDFIRDANLTKRYIGFDTFEGYTEQDTCTNYWINANHRDAFALPYNDVRYWVYFSPAKRNEKM